MTAEPTSRPTPGGYCFSSMLLFYEEDRRRVHPGDLDAVLRAYPTGWQLVCFRYLGREGDYDVLDDGALRMRVCGAVVQRVPTPRYAHGQRVYAMRKQAHGVVRRIEWHWNRKQPYYLLNVNGRRSGYRYFDADVEPARAE